MSKIVEPHAYAARSYVALAGITKKGRKKKKTIEERTSQQVFQTIRDSALLVAQF